MQFSLRQLFAGVAVFSLHLAMTRLSGREVGALLIIEIVAVGFLYPTIWRRFVYGGLAGIVVLTILCVSLFTMHYELYNSYSPLVKFSLPYIILGFLAGGILSMVVGRRRTDVATLKP